MKELSYTPRTCGALPVQLEFDFGPEFTGDAFEIGSESTTYNQYPESPCSKEVSLKTRRVNDEN
jgi:hypothetical protein